MNKYIFKDDKLTATPYNHACSIKEDYDITVRLIILDKERLIYIRINDLSPYQGLEYKRVTYRFNKNLRACEAYLRREFKGYRIYDSYSINELPYQLQKDILNS